MEDRAFRGGTFSFRRRWAQIDWRSLAGLDVDRIAQTVDVQTLQASILNVTFCNVTNEEFHNVDVNFIKLFRLSQLIIEYLLYTQQYLTDQIQILQDEIKTLQKELDVAKSKATGTYNTMKALKKENRKRRKIIESYQQMLNAGATGIYPCHICHREFISADFLKSHVNRRHSESVTTKDTTTKQDDIKFSADEIEAKLLQKVNVQLVQAQSQIQQELTIQETQLLEKKMEKKMSELEEWKKREIEKLKVELETYNQSVKDQLHQHNTEILQQTVEQAQSKLKVLHEKQSEISAANGIQASVCKNDFNQTKEELVEVKEQLQLQLNEVQNLLEKQNKDWKKKLKEATKSYELQLQQSHNRLEILEQSLQIQQINITSLQESQKSQQPHLMSSPQPTEVVTEQLQKKEKVSADIEALLFTSNSSSESSYKEETDSVKQFTPFAKHPIITSQFDHNFEQISQLRNTMETVMDEELNKRGINALNGLNELQLKEKLNSLKQERNTRTQTCPSFNIVRTNVEDTVNADINTHYLSTTQTVKKPPIPSNKVIPASIITTTESPTCTPATAELITIENPTEVTMTSTAVATKTTPVPINPTSVPSKPTAVASKPTTVASKLTPVTTKPTPVTTKPTPVATPPVSPIQTIVELTETDSITELSEDTDTDVNVVIPFSSKSPTIKKRVESAKNSSSDSIEELITAMPASIKVSSTPVKATVALGLDPPPAGVPVMIASHPIPELENEEDSDSFSLSEATTTAPRNSPPKTSSSIPIQSIPLMSNQLKQESHSTSRSALITITDDFDLSDIETTYVT